MIVNGLYQTDIDIADRALQYGDGCFTTIALRNACLEFYDSHIQRLKLACEKLQISFLKWDELTRNVLSSVTDIDQDMVVKIIISRGVGGRGYSSQGCNNPSYIITHHSMPAHYHEWQKQGIELIESPIKLAKQPLLAGIKHLNRLEQVLIKQQLITTNYPDALVCDTEGSLIETSIGNVFWKKGNQWFTPDMQYCGVEGVMRNQVICLLESKHIKVHVVQQALADLANIQEMFICNSLMQIVPVTKLFLKNVDEKISTLANKETQLIQSWLNQISHCLVKDI
ncbi:aminodeoxychorismate lyase [Paraglaciecola aquimarina]|uniref:Aminodeoxychorismate lyase n=1 Tax=Paraglaciecola algarum TaxID=3050085 RepID=A0ABS9DC21_9ALTE|nr:aminodeoxychorismate lyase [Paraglaciecola sp. G1-23]MCF2950391.1 aminodeoxychorismate lyase [Paraglaciecola sp. G1-23]